jgi:hypothetical protein
MALPGATRSERAATLEQAIADFGGKSYTPLNAARVAHAAQAHTLSLHWAGPFSVFFVLLFVLELDS